MLIVALLLNVLNSSPLTFHLHTLDILTLDILTLDILTFSPLSTPAGT